MHEKKKITSPMKAIRSKCRECVGSLPDIENCMGLTCPLYAFRSGKNPFRTVRILTEEQRLAATERFRLMRENKE
jgi:hypothetical protein